MYIDSNGNSVEPIFCDRISNEPTLDIQSKQQTAIIYLLFPDDLKFYLVDKDCSKYANVYINSTEDENLCIHLWTLISAKSTKEVKLKDFRKALLNPKTKLIQCGEY